MPRILLVPCCLLFCFSAFPQSAGYRHFSTLGVNYCLTDFQYTSAFRNLSATDPGISLSYLNGITSLLDYSASISASFPDSVSKMLGSGKKSLLVQSEFSLRARLLPKQAIINPFIQTGVGFSSYKSWLASYILFGPGLEFSYKDVCLNICFQYRPSLARSLNKHFFYSIGIAGLIGKKQKKKPIVAVQQKPAAKFVVGDADGDGIVDSADFCPTVPGLARYRGCPVPDTDKDGINDEEDKCPNTPGLVEYAGCPVPDTDKDGINDEQDSCINLPGSAQNHGCPFIEKSVKDRVELAAKSIFFRTGSSELLPSSYAALNSVVKILQENMLLRLRIEGHTDDVGSSRSNLVLSKKRAEAVSAYLISKGIELSRLKPAGYGETHPVDTNETSEGRAHNRRVEFTLEW